MKIPFILSLLLLAGAPVHGQDAPTNSSSPGVLTVAVYDFKGDAAAASYGKNVTTLVTANLTTETNLVLLERVELSKALSEQAFGVSGLVNSAAAAQIGQITGAKILVAGQVMKTGDNHVIIVANIIGTETGRLFADKVEGGADNLTELASDLSRKIAQTISDQATNLIAVAQESRAERLERIIKSITDTNRPSVSVKIVQSTYLTASSKSCEAAFGAILMKAGFTVVDAKSDRKPDIEITGVKGNGNGPHRNGMYSAIISISLKVQDRRTGAIIALEHETDSATNATKQGAYEVAMIRAIDALAEKVLPLLAK